MITLLLVSLRVVTDVITFETILLEETGSILFPIREKQSQVMETCGIWSYGEIPIDMSL